MVTMIIVILSTIKLKIKARTKKAPSNINFKPIKLSIPLKILGYLIYFLAIIFFLFLIAFFSMLFYYSMD